MNAFDRVARAIGIGVSGAVFAWSLTLAIAYLVDGANRRVPAPGGWLILPVLGSIISFFVGIMSSLP